MTAGRSASGRRSRPGAGAGVRSAASVTRPCRVQWLDQRSGVTFTTVRRPQRTQYRGGSSSLAARQASCPLPWAEPPPAVVAVPAGFGRSSGSLIGAQPTPRTTPAKTFRVMPWDWRWGCTRTVRLSSPSRIPRPGSAAATSRCSARPGCSRWPRRPRRGARRDLDPGQTTVGTWVLLEHRRASPLGSDLEVEAELTELDGRRLVFGFIAFRGGASAAGRTGDSDEARWLGAGTLERVVVYRDHFLARAAPPSRLTRLRSRWWTGGRRPRVGDHVDQVGHAGVERAAQRWADRGRAGDHLPGAAERRDHLVVPAPRLQVGATS